MKLYALNLSNSFEYCNITMLEKFVDNSRREKIQKHKFLEDKIRSLYSELLIRYIICVEYEISNWIINFNTTYYGKPFYEYLKDFHFNISLFLFYLVLTIYHHSKNKSIEM